MAPRPGGSPEPSDGKTVRLLKKRSPDGLRHLLRKYGGLVRWELRQEFGTALSPMEEDETINRAAHNVWLAADRFDPGRGTLRAWFFQISRRCALQVIRRERRARRRAMATDLLNHTVLTPAPPADPTRRRLRFIEALRTCISKLPPLQKEIISADLGAGDVANSAELARQHGTTPNSIYASRSIARRVLREQLTRLGHDPTDLQTPREK